MVVALLIRVLPPIACGMPLCLVRRCLARTLCVSPPAGTSLFSQGLCAFCLCVRSACCGAGSHLAAAMMEPTAIVPATVASSAAAGSLGHDAQAHAHHDAFDNSGKYLHPKDFCNCFLVVGRVVMLCCMCPVPHLHLDM